MTNQKAPLDHDVQRVTPIRATSLLATSQIGAGIPDADAVARDMTVAIGANHVHVSAGLAEYFNRNRGWLDRVFKTKLDKVLEDGQLQQGKTELDYQQRMLELATESKYQAARETIEAWVKALKIGQREKFGSFATERLGVFQVTVEDRRRAFVVEIKRAHETLSSCTEIPELHRRYRESLEREIANFFDLIDALLEDFKNVVHERVVTFDRPSLPSR